MTIDPNLISRVLEGRATSEERARVLAAADESPELLGILADAAAAMNAAEPAQADVIPLAARRRMIRAAMWSAIAAAVVFAGAIPMLRRSNGGVSPLPLSAIEAGTSAVAAARSGATLPGVRGEGGTPSATAVMLGARVLDYTVLAQARDTAATTAAIEVVNALRSIAGGSAAAAQFDALTANGSARAPTPEVMRAIEQLFDRDRFRAAAWTELGRLYSGSGAGSTTRAADISAAFERIAATRELDEESRSLAATLVRLVAAQPVDWPTVGTTSAALLRSLAR
jgi:hypothetical protein